MLLCLCGNVTINTWDAWNYSGQRPVWRWQDGVYLCAEDSGAERWRDLGPGWHCWAEKPRSPLPFHYLWRSSLKSKLNKAIPLKLSPERWEEASSWKSRGQHSRGEEKTRLKPWKLGKDRAPKLLSSTKWNVCLPSVYQRHPWLFLHISGPKISSLISVHIYFCKLS